MTTVEQVQETKDNSLYLECNLVQNAEIGNALDWEIAKDGLRFYAHLDAMTDIDYKKKKVKLYINKLKTSKAIIDKIRTKYQVIAETD